MIKTKRYKQIIKHHFKNTTCNVSLLIGLSILIYSSLHLQPTHTKKNIINSSISSPETYKLKYFNDNIYASKQAILDLQQLEHQNGKQVSYHTLQYDQLLSNLETILKLDKYSPYPLFMATRLYAHINNTQKSTKMLLFAKSNTHPETINKTWIHIAHAAILAHHKLKNQKLALELSEILYNQSKNPNIPIWAKNLHWVFHSNLNQHTAAITLIEGVIAQSETINKSELNFLIKEHERLTNLMEMH